MKFGSILIEESCVAQMILRETFDPDSRLGKPCLVMSFEMRSNAALISVIAVSRSVMRVKVRSMSTDRRGMSSSNRLMAVPPLRAKASSFSIRGMTLTTRAAWRAYWAIIRRTSNL